jgi:hypothetical protein
MQVLTDDQRGYSAPGTMTAHSYSYLISNEQDEIMSFFGQSQMQQEHQPLQSIR